MIFEGEAQRIRRAREGLAFVTRIQLGDRVNEVQKLSGSYNRSWAGHASVREIAVSIISEGLGLLAGPLTHIPEDATFNNFYWAGGPAAAALTALLRPLGLTWFEEDGVVRVHAPGKAQSDGPRIRITPETGLIGSPITTDEGAELRVFLDGRITLGSIVDVESGKGRDRFEGKFKVVGLRHVADNWEASSFVTHAELRPLA